MASDAAPLTCPSRGFVSSAGAERCAGCGTKLSPTQANPREAELGGGPEASLGPFRFWTRPTAALIDLLALVLVFMVIGIAFSDFSSQDAFTEDDAYGWSDWLSNAVLFGYANGLIAVTGQTPGEVAVGIEVTCEDESRYGLSRAGGDPWQAYTRRGAAAWLHLVRFRREETGAA